jgi:hypothetical protein
MKERGAHEFEGRRCSFDPVLVVDEAKTLNRWRGADN